MKAAEAELVACRERESRAEPGATLRWEWRLRRREDVPEAELAAAFGADWRRWHEGPAELVLEKRRLTLGGEEPREEQWRPAWLLGSREEVLDHLDSDALAVPEDLLALQVRRAIAARERAEAREAERLREEAELHRLRERQERQRRAAAAFERLAKSKDGAWAERWNDFVEAAGKDPELVARIRADERASALHDEALAAESVPGKRRAIRAFLARAEQLGAGVGARCCACCGRRSHEGACGAVPAAAAGRAGGAS